MEGAIGLVAPQHNIQRLATRHKPGPMLLGSQPQPTPSLVTLATATDSTAGLQHCSQLEHRHIHEATLHTLVQFVTVPC